MRRSWVVLALCLAGCSGARPEPPPPVAAQPAGTPDHALGLSPTSVFDTPHPQPFDYADESGKRLQRPWHGSPPRPPHDTQGYLPITQTKNECLGCHELETDDDTPPLPKSHRVDLRNAPGVVGKAAAGARWVCSACHVPHANLALLQ